MTGLNYVKMPRNISEYTLMKGVTDFSNLRQFDMYETGYSFLTVVSIPRFMDLLAQRDADKLGAIQDGFIHIMEGEFRGLSGIPDINATASEITNGINNLQLINSVEMDTSIQVSMNFWERSGSLVTNYLQYYMTGIKDPYSRAKTYHGLIADGTITDPGPDWEVFTFLYYVTDNTMRNVEKAYLLCNAQPTSVPMGDMYDSQRGSHEFKDLSVSFNCYPIMGDQVNKYAAMMLQNDLTTSKSERMLVLDSNDYKFDAYSRKVENSNSNGDGSSRVKDIVTNTKIANTVTSRTNSGTPLG